MNAEVPDETILGGVTYRLMNKGEGAKAHKFMAEQGAERAILSFPTVLALEGKKIIGLFGTHPRNDMILAGPLIVAQDRPRYRTIIRLIDSYENILRQANVKSYIWYTDTSTKWVDFAKRVFDLDPYSYRDGKAFFVKRI